MLAALVAVCSAVPARAQDAAADSPDVAKVRQIESDWASALVKKDQYALDLALGPTYVDISATGEVTTKNQQIAHLFAPNYGLLAYNATITSIRVLGDTAIAQGTYTLRRKWGGDVQEERGIFTHLYQRTRDSWQCVNGQRTVVREQVAPPRKSEKAELPFHVPFTGGKKKQDDNSSTVTMMEPAKPATAQPAPAAADPAATPPAADAAPAQQPAQPTLENVK